MWDVIQLIVQERLWFIWKCLNRCKIRQKNCTSTDDRNAFEKKLQLTICIVFLHLPHVQAPAAQEQSAHLHAPRSHVQFSHLHSALPHPLPKDYHYFTHRSFSFNWLGLWHWQPESQVHWPVFVHSSLQAHFPAKEKKQSNITVSSCRSDCRELTFATARHVCW